VIVLPATYEPIATTTLSTTAATVTFSTIPGTYTDLILVISATATTGSTYARMQFNSDTGTNYSYTAMRGNGTSADSARITNNASIEITYGNSITQGIGNIIVQIMNYSNTTTNKTALTRINNAGVETDANVGLWRSTSAITTIDIKIAASTFAAGSTFTLYGIKSA
jgi:hypothetical protein